MPIEQGILQNAKPCCYTFSSLIQDRFAGKLFAALYEHAGMYDIDIRYARIQSIFATAQEQETLFADVIFDCRIGIKDGKTIKQDYVSDFCISATDGFRDIHIRSVCKRWPSYQIRRAFDDDLIPVIRKSALEQEAQRLLREAYPIATRSAGCISPYTFAYKLGLSVEFACIDPTGEVMGKMFFENSAVTVYDGSDATPRIINVKRGAILINSGVKGYLPDERIANNTIMHECVHWVLHKFAFLLMREGNPQLAAFVCRRYTPVNQNNLMWTPLERMEWQASTISPRMLLQEWATRFYTDIWTQQMRKTPERLRTERIIERLSTHFGVSRSLARIRLIEAGYEAAIFLRSEQIQYDVTFEDVTREYQENGTFRVRIDTGAYVYADNRLVLRSRKFLSYDENGVFHLNAYAKAHPTECCLAFEYRRWCPSFGSAMFRTTKKIPQYVDTPFDQQDLIRATDAIVRTLPTLPTAFGSLLKAHMKRKGFTQEQLAEASLIGVRTIQAYWSGAMKPDSLRQVVTLCVGLRLHPILAEHMVRNAGYTFDETKESIAYHNILLFMYNRSIYTCNEYLRSVDVKPLGKEE